MRLVRSFGASRFTQVLSLAPGERRLVLDTEVDWHETEKLAFPLGVHAERCAWETQFGHSTGPRTPNTAWEAAKFDREAVVVTAVKPADDGAGDRATGERPGCCAAAPLPAGDLAVPAGLRRPGAGMMCR